jgi:hypothetical protein
LSNCYEKSEALQSDEMADGRKTEALLSVQKASFDYKYACKHSVKSEPKPSCTVPVFLAEAGKRKLSQTHAYKTLKQQDNKRSEKKK